MKNMNERSYFPDSNRIGVLYNKCYANGTKQDAGEMLLHLTEVTMSRHTQWCDCDDFNTMKLIIKKQFVIDVNQLFCYVH